MRLYVHRRVSPATPNNFHWEISLSLFFLLSRSNRAVPPTLRYFTFHFVVHAIRNYVTWGMKSS